VTQNLSKKVEIHQKLQQIHDQKINSCVYCLPTRLSLLLENKLKRTNFYPRPKTWCSSSIWFRILLTFIKVDKVLNINEAEVKGIDNKTVVVQGLQTNMHQLTEYFTFFVLKLNPWLDYNGPRQHFPTVVHFPTVLLSIPFNIYTEWKYYTKKPLY
jgi:hypothetical protein